MYTLFVQKDFVSSHFLIGGDWGEENSEHDHFYLARVELEGRKLNQHGFLVDIVDLEDRLSRLADTFKRRTLNEMPEFRDLNPSIEHFARILAEKLAAALPPNVEALTVRVDEDLTASASFRMELK